MINKELNTEPHDEISLNRIRYFYSKKKGYMQERICNALMLVAVLAVVLVIYFTNTFQHTYVTYLDIKA